jgi:hypothetical protein
MWSKVDVKLLVFGNSVSWTVNDCMANNGAYTSAPIRHVWSDEQVNLCHIAGLSTNQLELN